MIKANPMQNYFFMMMSIEFGQIVTKHLINKQIWNIFLNSPNI